MKLQHWKETGLSHGPAGRAIVYHDQGPHSAQTVLLLHGFPTASWDWNRIWPGLTTRFRVIAPDLLGYGFSDKPRDQEYPTSLQADRVEDLLQHLGIQQVHVLAHDYGGTVTQELLARSRPSIASAAFLNGGLFPETYRFRLVQELLQSPIGFLVGRLMSPSRFSNSLSSVFAPATRPTEAELQDFWALVSANEGRKIPHRLIRFVGERRRLRSRWVGALEQARIPLLLICGEADPVSGTNLIQRWRQLLPHQNLVVLPGIGHYPQVEAPEAVLQAYLGFLDGTAPKASDGSSATRRERTPHGRDL